MLPECRRPGSSKPRDRPKRQGPHEAGLYLVRSRRLELLPGRPGLPQPSPAPLPAADLGVEWRIAARPVAYDPAVAEMDARAAAIRDSGAPELIWLLEHPPLYTAGTSAQPADLLDARFPVHRSGRGGQYTYHGPGQRVAYVMLDLTRRGQDIRDYVCRLEAWIIAALAELGVTGERRAGRIGIWVARGRGREDKIAALGVRVRRWVTMHGLAINVAPDLAHFSGIVPCGVREHGVTSLADLGVAATMADLDTALRRTFTPAFAKTT
ncbi:MAG: lipoyl(octanoyl) transferase LipB [Proteobacteria bacterium]|nr:lipoyl(octanoyl) transferase LipB [Pseudomonadota bacterium]